MDDVNSKIVAAIKAQYGEAFASQLGTSFDARLADPSQIDSIENATGDSSAAASGKKNAPIIMPIIISPLTTQGDKSDTKTGNSGSKKPKMWKKLRNEVNKAALVRPKDEETLVKAIQSFYAKDFSKSHRSRIHVHLKFHRGWMCNGFCDYGYGTFKEFKEKHDLMDVYACLNEGCEQLCITWNYTRRHMAKCDNCPMFLFEEIPSMVDENTIWGERSKLSVQKALKVMESEGLLKPKQMPFKPPPMSVGDLMQKPSMLNKFPKSSKSNDKVSFACIRKRCTKIFGTWNLAATHIQGCDGSGENSEPSEFPVVNYLANDAGARVRSVHKWKSIIGEQNQAKGVTVQKLATIAIEKSLATSTDNSLSDLTEKPPTAIDMPSTTQTENPSSEPPYANLPWLGFACLRRGCKDMFQRWKEAQTHMSSCKINIVDGVQTELAEYIISIDDKLASSQSKSKARSINKSQKHLRRVAIGMVDMANEDLPVGEAIPGPFSCLRRGCKNISETWESAISHMAECKVNIVNGIQSDPKSGSLKGINGNNIKFKRKSAVKGRELIKAEHFLNLNVNTVFIDSSKGPSSEMELVNAIKDYFAKDPSGNNVHHRKRVWIAIQKEKGWDDRAMKLIYGRRHSFLRKHGLLGGQMNTGISGEGYGYGNNFNVANKRGAWSSLPSEEELVDAIRAFYALDKTGKSSFHRRKVFIHLKKVKGWHLNKFKYYGFGSWDEFSTRHNLQLEPSMQSNSSALKAKEKDIDDSSKVISSYDAEGDTMLAVASNYGGNSEAMYNKSSNASNIASSAKIPTTKIQGKSKPNIGSKRSAPGPYDDVQPFYDTQSLFDAMSAPIDQKTSKVELINPTPISAHENIIPYNDINSYGEPQRKRRFEGVERVENIAPYYHHAPHDWKNNIEGTEGIGNIEQDFERRQLRYPVTFHGGDYDVTQDYSSQNERYGSSFEYDNELKSRMDIAPSTSPDFHVNMPRSEEELAHAVRQIYLNQPDPTLRQDIMQLLSYGTHWSADRFEYFGYGAFEDFEKRHNLHTLNMIPMHNSEVDPNSSRSFFQGLDEKTEDIQAIPPNMRKRLPSSEKEVVEAVKEIYLRQPNPTFRQDIMLLLKYSKKWTPDSFEAYGYGSFEEFEKRHNLDALNAPSVEAVKLSQDAHHLPVSVPESEEDLVNAIREYYAIDSSIGHRKKVHAHLRSSRGWKVKCFSMFGYGTWTEFVKRHNLDNVSVGYSKDTNQEEVQIVTSQPHIDRNPAFPSSTNASVKGESATGNQNLVRKAVVNPKNLPESEEELVGAIREYYALDPSIEHRKKVHFHLRSTKGWKVRVFNMFGYGSWADFVRRHNLDSVSKNVSKSSHTVESVSQQHGNTPESYASLPRNKKELVNALKDLYLKQPNPALRQDVSLYLKYTKGWSPANFEGYGYGTLEEFEKSANLDGMNVPKRVPVQETFSSSPLPSCSPPFHPSSSINVSNTVEEIDVFKDKIYTEERVSTDMMSAYDTFVSEISAKPVSQTNMVVPEVTEKPVSQAIEKPIPANISVPEIMEQPVSQRNCFDSRVTEQQFNQTGNSSDKQEMKTPNLTKGEPKNEEELLTAIQDYYALDASTEHRKKVHLHLRKTRGWKAKVFVKYGFGTWLEFVKRHDLENYPAGNLFRNTNRSVSDVSEKLSIESNVSVPQITERSPSKTNDVILGIAEKSNSEASMYEPEITSKPVGHVDMGISEINEKSNQTDGSLDFGNHGVAISNLPKTEPKDEGELLAAIQDYYALDASTEHRKKVHLHLRKTRGWKAKVFVKYGFGTWLEFVKRHDLENYPAR